MGGEKLKSSQARLGILVAAVLLAAGFFCITSPLSAQTGEFSVEGETIAPGIDESAIIIGEAPAAEALSGGSSVFVMLRMVLVLALAALAIYGVVFFIKRLARPQESRDPHLKILARVPLGNDSFAAVVSVGAKAWLVGGGSGGLNLISEIDEAESLETMLLDDARRAAEAETKGLVDFRSLLRRFGGSSRERSAQGTSGQNIEGANNSGSPHVEALRKQRERLRGL